MKLLHIADLHLGKVMNGVDLLNEDQRSWVERFLEICGEERPDAVLIAGDVYDRSVPPGEAVRLLDRLLTGIHGLGVPVLMVAGNHDSGRRLSFGDRIFSKSGVYIAGEVRARMMKVTLEDAFGPVDFYLMPYAVPASVGRALDTEVSDMTEAARLLIGAQGIDPGRRNVIVCHQNVTWGGREAARGGSESSVGGADGMDAGVLDPFDYAALGHIHAAQWVGRREVRYAGSPLCYHFDELKHPEKGPVRVTLGPRGEKPEISVIPVEPLHPLFEVRAPLADVLAGSYAHLPPRGAWVKAVVTDSRLTPEASAKIDAFFEARGCRVLERAGEWAGRPAGGGAKSIDRKQTDMADLFFEFYRSRTGGVDPDETEEALIRMAARQIREEDGGMSPEEEEKAVRMLADEAMKLGGKKG